MTLTVTFKLGTDPDKAQQLVQNRVAQAEPRLPEEVRRLGVTTVKSSPDLTMVVHLRLAERPLRHDLPAQLRACSTSRTGWRASTAWARCSCSARGDYSMRVWLDPQKVAERGLTAGDVVARSASRTCRPPPAWSAPRPACRASTCSSRSTRRAACRARRSSATSSSRPAPNGAVTRLRDVARVELGAADYALRSLLDNKAAVAIGDLPGARLQRARRSPTTCARTMDELKKDMPEGVDYEIVYDPTQFVRASIEAVVAHAARGDRAGRAGRDPVPADLARLDHPAAGRAGVDRRHLRGACTCSASRSTR